MQAAQRAVLTAARKADWMAAMRVAKRVDD